MSQKNGRREKTRIIFTEGREMIPEDLIYDRMWIIARIPIRLIVRYAKTVLLLYKAYNAEFMRIFYDKDERNLIIKARFDRKDYPEFENLCIRLMDWLVVPDGRRKGKPTRFDNYFMTKIYDMAAKTYDAGISELNKIIIE